MKPDITLTYDGKNSLTFISFKNLLSITPNALLRTIGGDLSFPMNATGAERNWTEFLNSELYNLINFHT